MTSPVHPAAVPFHPRRDLPLELVVPRRIDPTGARGPTRHQARRGQWTRTGPGLYVPAGTDRHRPEQRAVELLARYDGAAVSGWGALWLAGASYFDGLGPDGTTPLPLVIAIGDGSGRRGTQGARLSYEPLDRDDVCTIHDVRSTRPVRALYDELRGAAGWREAVVAVDMATAAGVVSSSELAAYVEVRRSWRRGRRVQAVLPHTSCRSMSPNETRLRLLCTVDAGLPPLLVNQDVYDRAGQFVCRADLLDPVAGLVIEYDGADHRTARRHARDVAREERCRELGLEYVVVTALDLLDPRLVVARILGARARARHLPPDRRPWRLTP